MITIPKHEKLSKGTVIFISLDGKLCHYEVVSLRDVVCPMSGYGPSLILLLEKLETLFPALVLEN